MLLGFTKRTSAIGRVARALGLARLEMQLVKPQRASANRCVSSAFGFARLEVRMALPQQRGTSDLLSLKNTKKAAMPLPIAFFSLYAWTNSVEDYFGSIFLPELYQAEDLTKAPLQQQSELCSPQFA